MRCGLSCVPLSGRWRWRSVLRCRRCRRLRSGCGWRSRHGLESVPTSNYNVNVTTACGAVRESPHAAMLVPVASRIGGSDQQHSIPRCGFCCPRNPTTQGEATMFDVTTFTLNDLFTYGADVPPNLTVSDEAATILAAQSGDETAKLTLMAVYAPAIRDAVARHGKFLNLEDAQGVALVAVCEAIDAWDPDRGVARLGN